MCEGKVEPENDNSIRSRAKAPVDITLSVYLVLGVAVHNIEKDIDAADIAEQIFQLYDYKLEGSTVFKAIKSAREEGLIKSEWKLPDDPEDDEGNPRRVFSVTKHGIQCYDRENMRFKKLARKPIGLKPCLDL